MRGALGFGVPMSSRRTSSSSNCCCFRVAGGGAVGGKAGVLASISVDGALLKSFEALNDGVT